MQTPNGRMRFPDGIAVRLKPHQFYRDDETSPPISGAGCFTVKEGLMCPLATTLSSASE